MGIVSVNFDAVRMSVNKLRAIAASGPSASELANMAEYIQMFDVGGADRGTDADLDALKNLIVALRFILTRHAESAENLALNVTDHTNALEAAMNQFRQDETDGDQTLALTIEKLMLSDSLDPSNPTSTGSTSGP